jgi:hypothetical protein
VTADLVSKRGYSDTTTELIVRRAKVGYGTFYKFFADKKRRSLLFMTRPSRRPAGRPNCGKKSAKKKHHRRGK